MKQSNFIVLSVSLSLCMLFPTSASHANAATSAETKNSFQDKATGDWNEERRYLKDKGIKIDLGVILEGFYNCFGGIHAGTVAASTTDLSISLDTEKAFNWKGGLFYLDIENHAGRDPTRVLVGDLQIFDKQNATPYLQVYELWYQYTSPKGVWRTKVGKVDANNEFSVIENGLVFINSSAQISPTILSFPTTPDPMFGVNVFFKPVNYWYLSLAAYDANRSDTYGNFYGNPEKAQLTSGGALLIGETGLIWEQNSFMRRNGNIKIGAWGHTGTFKRLKEGKQKGAQGFYLLINQTLWQPKQETEHSRGIRSYLSYGLTQSTVSPIDWNLSGGVTWTGLLESRKNDVLGFSANYAHISNQAGLPYSYELALEWLYLWQVFKWASMDIDLQHIIHPGGQYANALVGTLRMTIHF